MTKSAELYEKWLDWNFVPPPMRVPRTLIAFSKENNVTKKTLINWKDALGEKAEENEAEEFREWIKKRAYGTQCPTEIIKLYARILKLDVERKEVTHKFDLTADDHNRIRREAEQRVRDLGAGGDTSLLAKSTLLSDEVRQDSGQDKSEDY